MGAHKAMRAMSLLAVAAVITLGTAAAAAATPAAAGKAGTGKAVAAAASTSCPLGDFCIWNYPNYQGTRISYVQCGVDLINPYKNDGEASWKNDQTPQNGTGPPVVMLSSNYKVVYTTPPPWSAKSLFGFGGIAYFRIC